MGVPVPRLGCRQVTKPIDPTEGLKAHPDQPAQGPAAVTKPIDPTEGLKEFHLSVSMVYDIVTKPIDPTEGLKDPRSAAARRPRRCYKADRPDGGIERTVW